jgi:hypothetical protein
MGVLRAKVNGVWVDVSTSTGPKGDTGAAGAAGAAGAKGADSTVPGPAGPAGAAGPQGLQGVGFLKLAASDSVPAGTVSGTIIVRTP